MFFQNYLKLKPIKNLGIFCFEPDSLKLETKPALEMSTQYFEIRRNVHTYMFNLVETLVRFEKQPSHSVRDPKASIRIEPRDDSIIDSWQIPKFKRLFSHIEMDRN